MPSEEVLLSTHVCHPSLCNDNLSGIAVMTELARELQARPRRRYSYRFLFIPGTIGSITWLARNEARPRDRARPGGGEPRRSGARSTTRRAAGATPRSTAPSRAVLKDSGEPFGVEEFVPLRLRRAAVLLAGVQSRRSVALTRTPYGRYPEYHTSADNLDFVKPEALAGSLRTYLAVVDVLEGNRRYLNLNPKCEPQLGRRGLYRAIGGDESGRSRELALLWVLNLSDGENACSTSRSGPA